MNWMMGGGWKSHDKSGDEVDDAAFGEDQISTPTPTIGSINVANSQSS